MDVFGPFILVLVRSMVILFPLTVGWLAFRRLALSKSSNAWYYAVVFLFSAVSAAVVLPWTLGMTTLNWMLVLLALASPAVWIGIILLCDGSRPRRYGGDLLADAAHSVPKLAPLLLDKPVAPKEPAPVFRHRARKDIKDKAPEFGQTTRTILKLARDIRGNRTSERRRPKLLPPPDARELSFLPQERDA